MAFVIYQVGHIPVFNYLQGVNNEAVSFDTSRSWKSASVDLNGGSGEARFNDPYNPLSRTPSVKIEGTLICDDEDSVPISNKLNSLMSLGGVDNIPFIAAYLQECAHGKTTCCTSCNMEFKWFISYGIINKIDRKAEIKSDDDPHSYVYQNVTIDADLDDRWKPLSPWMWQYRRSTEIINPFDDCEIKELPSTKFVHPSNLGSIQHGGYFFKWSIDGIAYEPEFWAIRYSGVDGGVGSGFTKNKRINVFVNPEYWSAPPVSMYAFTNLDATDELTIQVDRSKNLYSNERISQYSTLDLVQVNSDLQSAGYNGLYPTDILYGGELLPFPGFIVRSGEVLSDIRLQWSFDGRAAGMIGTGYNQISVSANTSDFEYAYLHEYRLY